MSFDAMAWAAKQNTGSSGTKLVLLGLAECADRMNALAFPSIAALVEFSSLDRKSVITNLTRLEAAGLIADTGRRCGQTKQIKVYQLNLGSIPKAGQSQKRNSSEKVANSPENGTRNKSEPVKPKAEALVSALQEAWNAECKTSGLHECRVMNNSRKQMARLRIKEHGFEMMLRAIKLAHASPLFRGKTGDGRRADITIILQPKTIARLLDGAYGDGPKEVTKITDPSIIALNKRATADLYDKMGRTQEADELRREAARLDRQEAA